MQAAKIDTLSVSSRGQVWKDLFRAKGWLHNGEIELPGDVNIYIYFPPSTTDINSIELVNLQRITQVTEHFIIHNVSANEEEYYLWEDIQCLRIRSKRNLR